MSEWKTYKLSDLVEIKYGKDHKHLADGVIPVYGSGGIMRYAETHLYDRESILIPRKGTLSNLFYLDKPFWSVDTMFYTKIKNGVHGKYLYYLLKSMDLASMNVGSAVPSLTTEVLNKVEISLPDLPTQRQIAQILTSLDDKIELNLQMNQTLEAMAQAIFKEWFVNFNFPGFDGELVDGLPKGWKKVKLSELIAIKHGYAFKGEFFSDFEEDNILLTPGNFKIGGGFNSAKFKYYNGEIPQEYILQRNDLVVTMTDLSKAGDTLGYSALVPTIEGKILLHNQRIGKVLFNSELPLKYFLYWTMRQDSYRHFVLGSATGSTVKHTSPSRICDYEIVLPQEFILSEFETLIKTLSDKQQENEMQIYKLTQTRDTLLPKLMSGSLEIN